MTDLPELTLNANQLPSHQDKDDASWNLEEYIVHWDFRTRVLTVEEFEGFTDDGEAITEVITDMDQVMRILKGEDPYVMVHNGCMPLLNMLETFEALSFTWTLGKEPI